MARSEPHSERWTVADTKSKKSPRQLIVEAQVSGTPEAAMAAALSIRRCRVRAGSGQLVRDAFHAKGLSISPHQAESISQNIDNPERACQELDKTMMGQYEPLLRQAMAGGIQGAAARWWGTEEAKSTFDASKDEAALNLLRRDAMDCDKPSLLMYQAVASRFKASFPAHELQAIRLAAEELEQAGQLKGNAPIREWSRFFPSTFWPPGFMTGDDIKAIKVKILAACKIKG